MRIFVAGATGTLGRPLVRSLLARGHVVTGMTRTPSKRAELESVGAHVAIADALDRERLEQVVRDASPTHVVHLLTALSSGPVLRSKDLVPTNKLRVQGTDNLLQAALAAGAQRFVAESFLGIYGSANRLLREEDPLPDVPAGAFAEAIAALRSLEEQLLAAHRVSLIRTVALRFGILYGASVASTKSLVDQLRKRRLFTPSRVRGLASFVQVDDAVAAVVAALEHDEPGTAYNIVDDDPMSMVTFIDLLSHTLGTPPRRTLPRWMVKLAAPVAAYSLDARLALSNAKARRDLRWEPTFPSARDGVRSLCLDEKARL